MSDQAKSTDEGVTVKDAEEVIQGIDSLKELEAYAGEEAADEDGRSTVKDAYDERKKELEAEAQEKDSEEDKAEEPEMIAVGTDKVQVLAEKCAACLAEDEKIRTRGSKLDHVEQSFKDVTEQLQQLAEEDGDEVEVPGDELEFIVSAIAVKANRDQERRGLNQPSTAQRSLIDARETAKEMIS